VRASKSAVSRRFVQLSQEQLAQWLARPIGELDLPVVMIDSIYFRDRVILLDLGIDAQGNKHVLGLRGGLHRGHAQIHVNAVALRLLCERPSSCRSQLPEVGHRSYRQPKDRAATGSFAR